MPGSSRWTRRELIAAGAVSAGYALAAGPVRAEAIHTDASGLIAGDVEIPRDEGPMPAYRAQPAKGGPFPVVLVVHEIFGVHEYVRDVCRRLAKEGWLAIAPDLYRRYGDPARYEDIGTLIAEVVSKVPDAEVLEDLDAALEWAGSHDGDPDHAAITGFCWGGRIVWLYAAHRPKLRAGAAWYGRLEGDPRDATPSHPIDVASGELPPVLGLYGGEDRGIPLESVHAMRKKLAEASQSSEIVVYPTAPHGFHADYRGSYREGPATEGWGRMLAWFRRRGLDGDDPWD